jgi:2-polyprenyl-3-methyl-5-hydroxy-6-metoxy-1,4-benzoquinol methylase
MARLPRLTRSGGAAWLRRWSTEPTRNGELHADVYDEHHAGIASVEATVSFLRNLAGEGPALELGIGTGRVALPLAGTGVPVHGIDASPRMVERMRSKPGGDAIRVTIGDFSTFDLGERFALIYVVFNTFFQVMTQDDQVECFGAVALT